MSDDILRAQCCTVMPNPIIIIAMYGVEALKYAKWDGFNKEKPATFQK